VEENPVNKKTLVELFPNSTKRVDMVLMCVGDIITNRHIAVRADISFWQLLTTSAAVKSLMSMDGDRIYTVSALKVKPVGARPHVKTERVKGLMEINPAMSRVVFTGLSGLLEDGQHVSLFVDPSAKRRFWAPAEYEPFILAVEDCGGAFYADDKRLVAALDPKSAVGNIALALKNPPVRGSEFISATMAEQVSTGLRQKLNQTAVQEVQEPVEPAQPQEPEPAEPAQLQEPAVQEVQEPAAPHPFGPGLDGPAPWEAGDTAELDTVAAVRQAQPAAPTAQAAPPAAPVPAPTAPGLDLIIPARGQVEAPAAPAISDLPEPVASAPDGSEPDSSQEVIRRAAQNPLAAWAIEHCVVGPDPSSAMIGPEVGRVIDEMRRAALAGRLPGVKTAVAGSLVKRVTASDYQVAVKLKEGPWVKPPPVSPVVLAVIDSDPAFVATRPLAELVDGELFQVLPPWVRQVFIAQSVLEMVDQIKAVAIELDVSPLDALGAGT
jgi:hypothetical protein